MQGPVSRESRELFGRLSGDILHIVASQGTKLCSYFNCHSLYNILKDRLYRISGVGNLRMPFRTRKVFGTFEKTGCRATFRVFIKPTSGY